MEGIRLSSSLVSIASCRKLKSEVRRQKSRLRRAKARQAEVRREWDEPELIPPFYKKKTGTPPSLKLRRARDRRPAVASGGTALRDGIEIFRGSCVTVGPFLAAGIYRASRRGLSQGARQGSLPCGPSKFASLIDESWTSARDIGC
jgi:hypothetical protein